jgi:hypothetical protein
VFSMLVVTSNNNESKHYLGSSKQVLQKNPNNKGHVSRNIRSALSAEDLMESHVSIVSVNNLSLSDVDNPLTLREDTTTCRQTKGVAHDSTNCSGCYIGMDCHWSLG